MLSAVPTAAADAVAALSFVDAVGMTTADAGRPEANGRRRRGPQRALWSSATTPSPAYARTLRSAHGGPSLYHGLLQALKLAQPRVAERW